MADELVWGLQNGDLEAVKTTLDKARINETISGGRSAIHVAADYGQTEVIKYLVENGANVNKEDEHGITPLLAAIWENHIETVKYLLQKGANLNKEAPSGMKYCECAESEEMKLILS